MEENNGAWCRFARSGSGDRRLRLTKTNLSPFCHRAQINANADSLDSSSTRIELNLNESKESESV
mgnify:CR=1 FL=1